MLVLLLSDTDGWVCSVCLHPGRPTPEHNLMNGTSSHQSRALFCSLPAVWFPRRGSSQLRDEVFTCQQSPLFLFFLFFVPSFSFVFPLFILSVSLAIYFGKKKGEKKRVGIVLNFKCCPSGGEKWKRRRTTKSAFSTAASADLSNRH